MKKKQIKSIMGIRFVNLIFLTIFGFIYNKFNHINKLFDMIL